MKTIRMRSFLATGLSVLITLAISIQAARAGDVKSDAKSDAKNSGNVAANVAATTEVKPEAASSTKFEWGKIFDLCDSDFERYETSLRTLRDDLKKGLTDLPQNEYLQRYGNNDPEILFVSANWPADLQDKDHGWEYYKTCAEDNWNVRKSLEDTGLDKKTREEKVGILKDCLVAHYTKSGLEFPFDRMVACYEKHAARP